MQSDNLHKAESVAKLQYFSTEKIKDGGKPICSGDACGQTATRFVKIEIGPFSDCLTYCEKCAKQREHWFNSLPGPEETPIAEVIPYVSHGHNYWKIAKCPYCLEEHLHGADENFSDKSLGHRVAHCDVKFKDINSKGYILTKADHD